MTVGRFIQMDEVAIARLCHEVNRGYCEGIGDHSQVPWEQAPESVRQSAIKGVRYALKHPEATPESQHQVWMDDKIKEGFVYGPEKDLEKKTHHCLVPYGELPEAQRVKDYLFLAVVRANS